MENYSHSEAAIRLANLASEKHKPNKNTNLMKNGKTSIGHV